MQTASVNFVPLNSSPLLKACAETNFIYENLGQGLNEQWKFKHIEGKIFHSNLVLVESYLPNILSHIMLHSFIKQQQSLIKVVNTMEELNPLNLEGFGGVKFYKHKIKEFLKHLGLGLNAENVYFGEPNIYDHYPVLKDGEDILYYAENIEVFLNALLNKAELKILSEVYSFQGQSYLKLNLQITL
jgi:hypothetical protein